MKRMNEALKTLGSILVIVLFVGGLVLLDRVVKNMDAVPGMEEPSVAVSAKEVSIQEETDVLMIDVVYPQLSGLPEEGAEGRINSAVQAAAERTVAVFKETGTDDPSELVGGAKNSLWIDYVLHQPYAGIVSIELAVGEFYSGAAHPNPYVRTMSFDVASGDVVGLEDILVEDSALEELARQAAQHMDEDVRDGAAWFSDGAAPVLDNYQEFYYDPGHFGVIFNPYQVGPYVLGTVRIAIPWSDLEGVIRQ